MSVLSRWRDFILVFLNTDNSNSNVNTMNVTHSYAIILAPLWKNSLRYQTLGSCMCMHVCTCACSGCVLGSGPWGSEFKPNSGNFSIWFSICLPPAPPVHPAVIGYLAFAGVQIKGIFSWNNNGPGGTSGAHTTCCEERPVLLRVPSPAPGDLLARLTVPA